MRSGGEGDEVGVVTNGEDARGDAEKDVPSTGTAFSVY